ncbi:MAG: pyridoxal phosphate-dependent aminotransferase [Acidimicrobiales bacterium]
MNRPYLTSKLAGFGTTIFAEMSELAARHDAINLGQGYPDEDGPTAVLEAAVDAIRSGRNQYPPAAGVPELRAAIARHQHRFWGIELDPDTEVLVTAGATEALAGAMLGMLDTGDEVIMFEPMYDCYQAGAAMAGAVVKPVTLRPPDYAFDPDELRAAVSGRTRMILLNTPHNPTGKVFSRAELEHLAKLCIDNDLLVVTDEVYEHLTFDGVPHIPIATLPGMAERTVTIGSGGKIFRVTGWKVGWATGPAALVAAVRTAKQFLTFVSAGPFQPAVAVGLDLPDEYFRSVADDLALKRDRLVAGLEEVGVEAYSPSGGYFVTVDIRPIAPDGDGPAFCRMLPERIGVAAVPTQVFYHPEHSDRGRPLVRFAFCKRLDVIDAAVARLKEFAS